MTDTREVSIPDGVYCMKTTVKIDEVFTLESSYRDGNNIRLERKGGGKVLVTMEHDEGGGEVSVDLDDLADVITVMQARRHGFDRETMRRKSNTNPPRPGTSPKDIP